MSVLRATDKVKVITELSAMSVLRGTESKLLLSCQLCRC